MDLELEGRTVLVAGGSRGTGLAIAARFVREGARVVITGRGAEAVDGALGKLRDEGGKAEGIVTDMVSASGVALIEERMRASFGTPDILVVNPPSPARTRGLLDTSDAEFDECFEAYVLSLVRLCRRFLPGMAERGWGRVILLGAANMKSPNSLDPIYSQNIRVAGAALMKTLTHEFSARGITFNTLAIGAIHTDLARAYLSEAPEGAYEAFAGKVPIRRWGEVEDLADVTAFLCSQRAGYINGEVIRVDGGMIESMF